MQINSLRDLLKGVSLPAQTRTPAPERNKVVAIPTRIPVNRQALRVILSNKDWLAEPRPETLERPTREAFESLAARLKTEYNEHALTRDRLGASHARIKVLSQENQELRSKTGELSAKIRELESLVRQLEDLKL